MMYRILLKESMLIWVTLGCKLSCMDTTPNALEKSGAFSFYSVVFFLNKINLLVIINMIIKIKILIYSAAVKWRTYERHVFLDIYCFRCNGPGCCHLPNP